MAKTKIEVEVSKEAYELGSNGILMVLGDLADDVHGFEQVCDLEGQKVHLRAGLASAPAWPSSSSQLRAPAVRPRPSRRAGKPAAGAGRLPCAIDRRLTSMPTERLAFQNNPESRRARNVTDTVTITHVPTTIPNDMTPNK